MLLSSGIQRMWQSRHLWSTRKSTIHFKTLPTIAFSSFQLASLYLAVQALLFVERLSTACILDKAWSPETWSSSETCHILFSRFLTFKIKYSERLIQADREMDPDWNLLIVTYCNTLTRTRKCTMYPANGFRLETSHVVIAKRKTNSTKQHKCQVSESQHQVSMVCHI